MLFWLICAILTVATLTLVLRPLLARMPVSPAAYDHDVEVYKEQLAEIDRDAARGVYSETQAESARLEVSRRLLAADRQPRQMTPDRVDAALNGGASRRGQWAFLAISAAAVLFSAGMYLSLGRPGLPEEPHAARLAKAVANGSMPALIARVEERLRAKPDDGQGWDVIAPVYLKLRRYNDAITAYDRAIALLGEDPARLQGLGEAHLGASNGIVNDDARSAFRKMLKRAPGQIVPQYWLAIGLEQDGDPKGARRAFEHILEQASDSKQPLPPNVDALIRQRIAELAGQSESVASGEGAIVPERPADRARMIEGMVQGLADRLKADGGTLAEWQRLIRSYVVLGRKNEARQALAEAKKDLKTADATRTLDHFAVELGLTVN